MADQPSGYLSYLNLLPAIYDPATPPPASNSFITDYLKIFEQILSGRPSPEPSVYPSSPSTTTPSQAAIPPKGIGSVLDIMADLFYPRLSFLFPSDETAFMPPIETPVPAASDAKYDQHLLALLNAFIKVSHIEPWLDECLQWLASWISLVLAESWTLDKKRQTLAMIYPLYRQRGTLNGLQKLIELYLLADSDSTQEQPQPGSKQPTEAIPSVTIIDTTEIKPSDMEVGAFQLQPAYTQNAPILNGVTPYHFIVTVTMHTTDHQTVQRQKEVIEKVLQQEAPAHTSYQLIIETLTLTIGQKKGDAKIGQNTRLGNAKMTAETAKP